MATDTETKRARVWRGVGAVLLAGSLAAAAYFAYSSNEYFKQVNDVRLDPPGLRYYAKERAEAPPGNERPVLLFFGDSRALMWSAPDLPAWTIVDRGVGNQTTAQILLRFEADVPRLHPSVVVLQAGVNDLKLVGPFADRRAEIVATCKDNLTRMVARCRELGATVILTTVFAIGDVAIVRRPFWSEDVDAAVREVNQYLRTLASEKVVLFDSDAVLDDARGKVKPPYQYDFLHVSPAGYAALNEKLVPMLGALPR